jgi:hypothetical protein
VSFGSRSMMLIGGRGLSLFAVERATACSSAGCLVVRAIHGVPVPSASLSLGVGLLSCPIA